MKKDVYKARRNAQKSRTLRFENLETRELLCVDLTTILSYTSGTELDDASFPNAFPLQPQQLAHQGALSMGILQARILEWVAMPSLRH